MVYHKDQHKTFEILMIESEHQTINSEILHLDLHKTRMIVLKLFILQKKVVTKLYHLCPQKINPMWEITFLQNSGYSKLVSAFGLIHLDD